MHLAGLAYGTVHNMPLLSQTDGHALSKTGGNTSQDNDLAHTLACTLAVISTGRLRIPSFLAAAVILSTASSTCSKVWVAISEKRIRLRPGGTAGEMTGLTKTPFSSKSLVMLRALRSS